MVKDLTNVINLILTNLCFSQDVIQINIKNQFLNYIF